MGIVNKNSLTSNNSNVFCKKKHQNIKKAFNQFGYIKKFDNI